MEHVKETGFFTNKRSGIAGKSHAVLDGKPLCRKLYRVFIKENNFQWMGDGYVTKWIDCKFCLERLGR